MRRGRRRRVRGVPTPGPHPGCLSQADGSSFLVLRCGGSRTRGAEQPRLATRAARRCGRQPRQARPPRQAITRRDPGPASRVWQEAPVTGCAPAHAGRGERPVPVAMLTRAQRPLPGRETRGPSAGRPASHTHPEHGRGTAGPARSGATAAGNHSGQCPEASVLRSARGCRRAGLPRSGLIPAGPGSHQSLPGPPPRDGRSRPSAGAERPSRRKSPGTLPHWGREHPLRISDRSADRLRGAFSVSRTTETDSGRRSALRRHGNPRTQRRRKSSAPH
jgi:hypothetical protein